MHHRKRLPTVSVRPLPSGVRTSPAAPASFLRSACTIPPTGPGTLLRPPRFPFGLVFLDPPYHKNLCNMALTGLTERGWLAPEAFIAAEVELDAAVKAPDGLELLTERHFGQTRILIWTNA